MRHSTTISEVVREAKRAPKVERYATFFQEFRGTRLAFMACEPQIDVGILHADMLSGLAEIGALGVAEGVGACMHLYMLFALATIPLPDAHLDERRKRLLLQIAERRLLVANTGSDAVRRSDNSEQTSTALVDLKDGTYSASGAKTFLSLATVADLVLFTAGPPDARLCFCLAPLRDSGVVIGSSEFDSSLNMNTHGLEFKDVIIPEEMVFAPSGNEGGALFHGYQRAVFQATISAVYLGAAFEALKEAGSFAQSARIDTVDGVRAELGSLVMKHDGALAISRACREPLYTFTAQPTPATLAALTDTAMVAKHFGCQVAAAIVTSVQRFIGTRSMRPEHPLVEMSRMVAFGPLHPVVAAQAVRHFAQRVCPKAD
ncbi:MAG: acyl-CoA/acyl-ACP dehydrogenase [Ramlibacter sp.]|nr:acyl-CoA/acyl-ACP dehydrogenase [Ramlibacter sp.]